MTGWAFGLRFAYDPWLDLRLPPASGGPDAEIALGPPVSNVPGWQWSRDVVTCFEPGTVSMEIRGGRRITVSPDPAGDPDWIRELVLGPGLAILLHQRGFLVLHGSAVRVGDGALVILGDAGWGKSTFAAALDRAGCPLVADDLLPVRGTALHPGLPRAKLLPDAIGALGLAGADLTRLDDKQGWTRPGVAAPLPIARIVVLDPEDSPTVRLEPTAGAAAIVELARHTFLVRRLAPEERSINLAQCAALASVPMAVLRGPRRLDSLPARVAAVR
jgi:hypothetical protein